MGLEKTLESPLDSKEIKPVNPKGNQPWVFIGWTDAKAEAPVLSPPDAKNQLIGKDPDAEKDWGQEEKGVIEDKMVGWHHRLNGHEFEQTPGDSEGQGSLVCCSSCIGKSQIRLSNWRTVTTGLQIHYCSVGESCLLDFITGAQNVEEENAVRTLTWNSGHASTLTSVSSVLTIMSWLRKTMALVLWQHKRVSPGLRLWAAVWVPAVPFPFWALCLSGHSKFMGAMTSGLPLSHNCLIGSCDGLCNPSKVH